MRVSRIRFLVAVMASSALISLSPRMVRADEPPAEQAAEHAEGEAEHEGEFNWAYGFLGEKDGVEPHWRGIYDDSGRLMVVIDFNMDLGDAWEHADNPEYPLRYTTLAYQYAINYIVYSMTH